MPDCGMPDSSRVTAATSEALGLPVGPLELTMIAATTATTAAPTTSPSWRRRRWRRAVSSSALLATLVKLVTDRRLHLAMLALAILGVAIAGYLTYVHYRSLHPLCLAGGGGCER